MLALFPQRLISSLAAAGYLLALVGAGFLHEHHDAGACAHEHRALAVPKAPCVGHEPSRARSACRHAHGHGAHHHGCGKPAGYQARTSTGLPAPQSPIRAPRQQHDHGCAACDFLAMPVVAAALVAICPGEFAERAEIRPSSPAISPLVANDHPARGPPQAG